jgi:hypothetical protein
MWANTTCKKLALVVEMDDEVIRDEHSILKRQRAALAICLPHGRVQSKHRRRR